MLASKNRVGELRNVALGVAILMIIAGLFVATFALAPKTNAAWGTGGTGVGGSGVGFWTSNGFGWKLFSKAGSGPNSGFRDGTAWSSVQAACADYSGSGVWVHVVRNASGDEKSFNYSGTEDDRNRPTSGLDPYLFNAAGAYAPQGASWQPHVVTIISQVKSRFMLEHASYESHWGVDVGWFCDGPKEGDWTINGQSYIRIGSGGARQQGTINAKPTQQLRWDHDLRNNGPDDMVTNIGYSIRKSGFSNGWSGTTDPSGYAKGDDGDLFVTVYAANNAAKTRHTVTQDDVGNTLCQYIRWEPESSSDDTDATSAQACAYIPYSYKLTPTISNISDGAIVEAELGNVAVNGNVSNSGDTKSHSNITWQVTQLRFAPGVILGNSAGGVSGSNPCVYFTGEANCTNLSTGVRGYDQGASVAHNTNGSLGAEPIGTRLCYAMSVKQNASDSLDWRHSRLYCLVVGKQPKVHVTGGDLVVGRESATSKVSTGSTRKSSTYFGSWSEYAIIPSGVITGMSTGSGYAGGTNTTDLCAHHKALAFANTATSGSCVAAAVGGYKSHQPSPATKLKAQFATDTSNPSLSGAVDMNTYLDRRTYRATSNLTLTSSAPIGQNQWIIINAGDRDVTIASNITYTSSSAPGVITAANQLPQVVILARNIIINDNVSQVDAWLVVTGTGANGYLKTCDAAGVNEPSQLRDGVCGTKLTVNGPVMANHLLMYRTAGAGTGGASGEAAEVFNLRPDAYIWANHYQLRAGVAQTVDTKELPPRY